MADIFLSYSRANRGRVAQIADGLEESGMQAWWDRALGSGEDYGLVIEREIAAAGCVVVAWSATARQSLWVRAEANEALEAGKLVQINLDRSRLPLPFTMLHWLDFSAWRGVRGDDPWNDLEAEVRRVADGGRAGPAAAAPAQTDPLQGFGRIAWLGWLAILLAALTAGATGAAAIGRLPAAPYSGIILFALSGTALLVAASALLLARTAAASRR